MRIIRMNPTGIIPTMLINNCGFTKDFVRSVDRAVWTVPRLLLFFYFMFRGFSRSEYEYWILCRHAHEPSIRRIPLLAARNKGAHKDIPPATKPQSQSIFLSRLPLEIRTQILEYVLLLTNVGGKDFLTKTVCYYLTENQSGLTHLSISERQNSLFSDPWGWPLAEDYLRELDTRTSYLKMGTRVPSIMLSCRQAYAESIAIKYAQGTFSLSPYDLRSPGLLPVGTTPRIRRRPEMAFIRSLVVPLLVVEEVLECAKCKKLWENTWDTLGAFKGLRHLELILLTQFVLPIPHVYPVEPRWESEDVHWLKSKLLSMQHVPAVVVHFSTCLQWMVPALELDPRQFKLKKGVPRL